MVTPKQLTEKIFERVETATRENLSKYSLNESFYDDIVSDSLFAIFQTDLFVMLISQNDSEEICNIAASKMMRTTTMTVNRISREYAIKNYQIPQVFQYKNPGDRYFNMTQEMLNKIHRKLIKRYGKLDGNDIYISYFINGDSITKFMHIKHNAINPIKSNKYDKPYNIPLIDRDDVIRDILFKLDEKLGVFVND